THFEPRPMSFFSLCCAIRLALRLAALGVMLALPTTAMAQTSGSAVVRELVEPVFHSLKSDRVNVRRGPGLQYPIVWVFRRVGMPVEVIREFDNWWQVRDSEGDEGWVFKGLVTRRRTALVMGWPVKQTATAEASAPSPADRNAPIPIRIEADPASGVVAYVEAGTIAAIQRCDGRWCRVFIEPYEGWIAQRRLWGVHPQEVVTP
ncbi:MAG: SH3 domain-containing protein, partial [Pseudomonadota bacterium]